MLLQIFVRSRIDVIPLTIASREAESAEFNAKFWA